MHDTIGQNNTHRGFVVWIVFAKLIFSRLNLKPDYGFPLYSKPEVFIKTEHDITNIITEQTELKLY